MPDFVKLLRRDEARLDRSAHHAFTAGAKHSVRPLRVFAALTEDDEELIMPLLESCLDVPWILEAPPREI